MRKYKRKEKNSLSEFTEGNIQMLHLSYVGYMKTNFILT